MKKLRNLAMSLIVAATAGCSDNRPDTQKASRDFSQLYPGAQVVSVVISEDEVIARSFRFRYRKKAKAEVAEKEVEIQYMENQKTRVWEPIPKPPNTLP